jgi:hypothetical protein
LREKNKWLNRKENRMGKYKMRWPQVKKLGYIPEEYLRDRGVGNSTKNISPEPQEKAVKPEQESTEKVSPTPTTSKEENPKTAKKTVKKSVKKND